MRLTLASNPRAGHLALLPAAALLAFAVDAAAQAPPFRPTPGGRMPIVSPPVIASAGAPTTPPATTPPATPAPPNAPAGAASATPGAKPVIGPDGKAHADTTGLTQFEQGVEFQPRGPEYRVSFSLEDADLPELVRVIGELTGKRFIFGGKVRSIKATVFSPQKVTVAEAYQAFLSILEANGLTVVPHGRFLKIVETPGIAAAGAPVYGAGQGTPNEERYVTRIHRLAHVSADDASAVLGHFKSKDGDLTVYGPGNLLIITDTGTNIRRMMQIIEDIDVGGVGDQIWIEPIHYSAASDIANRLNDVFDLHSSSGGGGGGGNATAGKAGAAGGVPGRGGGAGSDSHIAKIIPDDRSNSLIIVATERAYLRVLEFIKRIDVPHSGEGEIHVLPLQHADAVDLAKTLNEIITGATQAATQGAGGGTAAARPGGAIPLTGVFESGVKISADKATNSIVITSSLRDYAAMRIVIDQLDQPRRQVFIEAVIMDLTISRQNQLGMSFHAGDVETSPIGTGQITSYGGLNPFRSILLPSPTDSTLSAFALGIRGPGLTGTENLFGTGVSIPAFGVLINALAATNDADILSTPHILATDNVKAEISVGQNIALQQNAPSFGGLPGATGTAAGGLSGLGIGGIGTTAPRQDIGTKITITPHLNDSNEVRLEVVEEISDVIGNQPQGTLGTIPFAKRTANTQLVVKDQQTVVIGGLVRNRVARADTKIPILGDVPVLGALFRSSSDSLDKTNLLLILTPHIIRDQDDLRVIFERKMQERQEFLDHYFVFSDDTNYKPPIDYSRVSGILEEIRQGYFAVEERKHIDELTRPKGIKTHDPGEPIEMPAASRSDDSGDAPAAGAPPGAPPAPPAPPPNLNVAPPARNIERVEH